MPSFEFRHAAFAGTAMALCLCATAPAFASDGAPATTAGDAASSIVTNNDEIIVTATKVNKETPITASVHTAEPQSIITRTIIEDSVSKTTDFMSIAALSPGASTTNLGNGPGFGDAKLTLRGFADGNYNITIDGIPFGDSNNPTHHSTAYFPDGTYDRIIIDRGPGYATDLGQASYGGNVHLISRSPEDKFGGELIGLYGSYNSQLERFTINSGKIAGLGDLKIIAVGEHKKTDGALTGVPGEWYNGFIKGELDLGDHAKLTLMSTYNHSVLYQPDSSKGASCFVNVSGAPTNAPAEVKAGDCQAASQIGTFGLNYSALSPAQAATSLWPTARNDWNWQNKSTDFEIARLQWDITPWLSLDNKAYTYFYKNFTFEVDDVSTPCLGSPTSATQCTAPKTASYSAYKNVINSNGQTVPGDIAGHTKLNQYRQIGDVLELDAKTSIGTAKAGFWYEHSRSHRIGYDYDLTLLSAAGGLGANYFDVAIANSGPYWNYNQKDGPTNVESNGTPVPLYLSYDEHTGWEQYQGFGEFEFKLLHDTLTVTPGVKVQSFTRSSATPLATQTAREGLYASETYRPTLPYFTANYLIKPNFSVYAQYAKGFVIPALSASLEAVTSTGGNLLPQTPTPTKTTNYQAGLVYAGERVNFDGDVYYVKASNSTYTDPSQPGISIQNANPATYSGVEAQLSYVLTKGLTAIVNGQIGKASDDVTHLWLPSVPNYTALIGAVYRTGGFKLSYTHKFTGHQYAKSLVYAAGMDEIYILPGYSTGTAVASYTWNRFTAGFSVDNVFNSRPTTAISLGSYTAATNSFNPVGTYYAFQSPRTVQASLKVKF
jgi:iron complex outermembrane receptor protein